MRAALLALLFWMAIPSNDQCEVRPMNTPSVPAFTPVSGEKSVTRDKSFSGCDKAIEAFASHASASVIESKYFVSPSWGKLVRAKVSYKHGASSTMLPVVCWSHSDSSVRIAVDVPSCCEK